MTSVQFTVRKTGLLALPSGQAARIAIGNATRAMNRVFTQARDDMRKRMLLVQRRSSGDNRPHLRDTVVLEKASMSGSALRAHLYSNDPRFVFFEEDTRPHLIKPRAGKAIAFSSGGTQFVRAWARHPGTKGHHVFQAAQKFIDIRMPIELRKAAAAAVKGRIL